MARLKLAVLASGRGSNLQAIIDNIEKDQLDAEIAVVVSDVAGAYALERAKNHGIKGEFINPRHFSSREAYNQALADLVQSYQVDLVVLAGYMRILTRDFLSRFPTKVVNIHPALLPSFPGLHAQAQAHAYGVKVSGCTVHFVDEGMDTGPIIAQTAVPVLDNDTIDTLSERILKEEHKLYSQVINWIAEGKVMVEGRVVRIKNEE